MNEILIKSRNELRKQWQTVVQGSTRNLGKTADDFGGINTIFDSYCWHFAMTEVWNFNQQNFLSRLIVTQQGRSLKTGEEKGS